jgi:phosphoheptose isomerase
MFTVSCQTARQPQIVLLRARRHRDASRSMSHFQKSLMSARETLDAVAVLEKPLVAAADAVLQALTSGHKLLICGNGGSSSDAAHIAAEFV